MLDSARLQRLGERLRLRARPKQLPLLVPFRMAGADIGHLAPEVARQLADGCRGFAMEGDALVARDAGETFAERTEFLAMTSRFLLEAGVLPGWRDELLAVRAGAAPGYIAAIERAACRPLGITTSAVHLNAYADPDSLFVARRSDRKQIDPGLWDNLVGGMVTAGETIAQALQREALEEAGLAVEGLALTAGRKLHVRRAVAEGFQSEVIHVYDVTLGNTCRLQNQDGEVSATDRCSIGRSSDRCDRA